MKKTLLALSLVVSSCFFVYAQVNIGQVQVNTQTGQFGVQGSVNGVPVSVGNTGVGIGGAAGSVGSFFNGGSQNGLLGLLALAQTLLVRLVPFLVGVAVLAFFWFLIEFIWKGREDAAAKTRSVTGMWWAVLALFVMVSIWGIIGFAGSVLGIRQGGSMPAFRLPGQ